MRVLVTGSRDWDNYRMFNAIMMRAVIEPHWDMGFDGDGHPVDWLVPHDFLLVHGHCPTGLDAMADEWMECHWYSGAERHPAEWETYGRRAGYVRNREMVDLGADLCIAFICHHSRGATMTARMAEKAGIPTLWVHETARADAA